MPEAKTIPALETVLKTQKKKKKKKSEKNQ